MSDRWLVRMKVYVAEQGLYEATHVAGVFDTPERGMAALPGNRWTKRTWATYSDPPDLARGRPTVSWENDLDWDDAVTIREMEITDDGPLRSVDESLVQTYRESDGGWDYLPERAR